MSRGNNFIRTCHRPQVWPLEPDGQSFPPAEIAHAIFQLNRFTGHTQRPYTVGEHSLGVANLAMALNFDGAVVSKYLERAALLHDGSEAYLADIAAPIKGDKIFAGYLEKEKALQNAIDGWWLTGNPEVDEKIKAIVKRADVLACYFEAILFMGVLRPEDSVEDGGWNYPGPEILAAHKRHTAKAHKADLFTLFSRTVNEGTLEQKKAEYLERFFANGMRFHQVNR